MNNNRLSVLKDFFLKPSVKSVVLALFTTSIAVVIGMLGQWDRTQNYFREKVGVFVIILFLYIVTLIIYTTAEVNTRKANYLLQNRVNSFAELTASLIVICEITASGINKCIPFLRKAQPFSNNWSFNDACKTISQCIYDNARKLAGSERYEVAYVKLLEDEENVKLVAFANQGHHQPSIYDIPRPFIDIDPRNAYHDLCLFHDHKSDNDILIGVEEVYQKFAPSPTLGGTVQEKYHLFIGIPVFCDSNKMIGLLEIVCMDDSNLGSSSRGEIEDITNKFFVPYAKVFLLLHKMEKAMVASSEQRKGVRKLQGKLEGLLKHGKSND